MTPTEILHRYNLAIFKAEIRHDSALTRSGRWWAARRLQRAYLRWDHKHNELSHPNQ